MPNSRDSLKQELQDLVRDGDRLRVLSVLKAAFEMSGVEQQLAKVDAETIKEAEEIDVSSAYQHWYTGALRVVEQLLPDRHIEFRELYRLDKRPALFTAATYTISDYLAGITVANFVNADVFAANFREQINILRSALGRLDSLLADITGLLEAGLFDDELSVARELCTKKHMRAAGVVAGVVLERHLKRVASNHDVTIRKKTPAIGDLNDTLKDAKVYDTPRWREIQRLGDIRNYASHDKERDPASDEIDELIKGVDKIVKVVF